MNTDKIFAEAIANEYSKKDNHKVVALKKLNQRAKLPSLIFAYTFGTAGALILGVGMCLAMGVIGGGGAGTMALGIAIGVAGIACVSANYPIYRRMLAASKEKYAGDIIRLAEEIARED